MDYVLLLTLWAGHYLADFSLQTQFMSETKGKAFLDAIGFHTLTAHAFVQGLVIGLLSGSVMAGIVVGVTHWIIDFIRASELIMNKLVARNIIKQKRKKLFGIHLDQALHFLVVLVVTWRLS
jgi:hypothetical protein